MDSSTKPCPPPVPATPIDLVPCCHGYVGGTNLYNSRKLEEELNLGSPPKRMFALYHPTYNGAPAISRTLHHYSVEDPCRVPPPCLPFSLSSSHHHHHNNHNHQPGQKLDTCPSLLLRDLPSYPGGVGGGGGGDGSAARGWGGGDGVRILARRVTPDGKVQYLVEWGNVNVY